MRNIILVDRGLSFIDGILQNTQSNIIVLVIDNEMQDVEKYRINPRIEYIYTVAELDTLNSTKGLDFNFVRKCKGAQLKAENAMLRFEKDYSEKKYRYYMGLAFWRTIFQEYRIDDVVVSGISHGFVYDGVLLEVALQYNVSAYSLNAIGISQWYAFIFDHNQHTILEVKNKKPVLEIEYYLKNEKYDVLSVSFDGDGERKENSTNSIKTIICTQIYRFFGYYAVEVLRALKNRSLFLKTPICSSGFKSSLYETLQSGYKMYFIQRYLNRREAKADLTEKFIYFPLHLEPEATTQTRMTIEDQIVIIKMLSECLPPGWKIFVKEHPHQYKLNNNNKYYLLVNGELFKTKRYYDRILSISNVVLVSRKYSGMMLVEKSQAVANLAGSVLLETIPFKKPILLFSEFHPFLHASSVLKCFSYEDCKQNVQRIYDGYVPDYSDILPVMNHYVTASYDDLSWNVENLLR